MVQCVEFCSTSSLDRFEAIYRRFHQYVAAVARRSLADASSVSDVSQETFLQLWLHIDRFADGSDPRPWLAVVARNCAYSLNRRSRAAALDAADSHQADHGIDAGVGSIGIIGPVPEETLALLWDRFGLGLTLAEISSRHGVPVGTLKSRLARALRRLRLPPRAGRAKGI